MKKVLLSVAVVAAFTFASCGGGPSVCDCVKGRQDYMKAMEEAEGDEAKEKEVKDKYKDQMESCKKLGEGKSEDELKKLEEEASKCK